jgi:organic radical activating enzyme
MANLEQIDEQKILFLNKKDIAVFDADKLHALHLNNWKDWWCSTGVRSLYIQHDGLIYRGTCQVGGNLGSIYAVGFDVHKIYDWIKCTKDSCLCASDMQTPKVKDFSQTDIVTTTYMKEIDYSDLNLVEDMSDHDTIFCGAVKHYKLVIWELGRRCNYDCWYCTADSHNNYEAHKTMGSLMNGLTNLSRFWAKDQKMKFVFTGGEPTFNPNYLEFVTHLHDDLLHIVHTTTNGTHNEAYYAKLAQVSDIGFSAHLTYLENPMMYDKFIKNLASAYASKHSNETSKLNWLSVKIMMQPGKLDLAKRVYDGCRTITKNITADLLHDIKTQKIMTYSQEEINWMLEVNQNTQLD